MKVIVATAFMLVPWGEELAFHCHAKVLTDLPSLCETSGNTWQMSRKKGRLKKGSTAIVPSILVATDYWMQFNCPIRGTGGEMYMCVRMCRPAVVIMPDDLSM